MSLNQNRYRTNMMKYCVVKRVRKLLNLATRTVETGLEPWQRNTIGSSYLKSVAGVSMYGHEAKQTEDRNEAKYLSH